MNTLQVGNLQLSRIILGTSYFGSAIPEPICYELLDAYYALGGRTIDTARVYGMSERVLGRWFALRRPRDIVLITKGAHPPIGRMNEPRLSRACVLDDAQRSVAALGRVPDLWLLHRDDPARPVEEIAQTMARLLDSDLCHAVGASNWTAARLDAYNTYAASHGLPLFAASEIQWSLALTTPEAYGDPTLVCMNATEYAWYAAHQFPVLAFSPQAKGFFSRVLTGGVDSLPEKVRRRFLTPGNLARAEKIRAESERTGRSPAALALDHITNNPAVRACAIVGCSSVAQLRDSLDIAD